MESGGAEFDQGGFEDCRRGVRSVRGFGERAMGILVGRGIVDVAEGDEGTLVVPREVWGKLPKGEDSCYPVSAVRFEVEGTL